MSQAAPYLLSERTRARWMRFDTAQILKRFFFCERALLLTEAAWLPLIASIEIKTELPRFIWQSAQTAEALRERVFELRFPNRMLEQEGPDRDLLVLVNQIKNSPSVGALLLSLGEVLLPLLRDWYRDYLKVSDPIADGPTHRFLKLALNEKEEQVRAMSAWAQNALTANPQERDAAVQWASAIRDQLTIADYETMDSSHIRPEPAPIPGSRSYAIPDTPARDPRFWPCRFYWPDIIDPSFPYGEGLKLQLRSAISHLNEVWAVETGGVLLSTFAHVLPWEWISDAARWTYDESRHCQMGYDRLDAWGLDPAEIPLGTYIYGSAAGQDPIYRLGMLYFFETKNIRHKPVRAELFHTYGDKLSEHDMDFDWADETIHAGYGRHWLKQLLAVRREDPANYEAIRLRCGELIRACVATATTEEIAAIKRVANGLIAKLADWSARRAIMADGQT
jgi:uncharacterized ferritin-like protein (DUF455 family)